MVFPQHDSHPREVQSSFVWLFHFTGVENEGKKGEETLKKSQGELRSSDFWSSVVFHINTVVNLTQLLFTCPGPCWMVNTSKSTYGIWWKDLNPSILKLEWLYCWPLIPLEQTQNYDILKFREAFFLWLL